MSSTMAHAQARPSTRPSVSAGAADGSGWLQLKPVGRGPDGRCRKADGTVDLRSPR